MSALKDTILKNFKYAYDNLSFILTLVITYGFGWLFVYLNIARQNLNSDVEIDYIQTLSIIIDNIIPTTVVYILGCIVNNMIEVLPILQGKESSKSENRSIVFNILTLIFLLMYVIFYCIYIYEGCSILSFVIGLISTFALIILNLNGYKEMHPSCTRSIS